RSCWLTFPTPGPYSTTTRALSQSIRSSMRWMRKRELGMTEPSIRGCCRKFFAKSRNGFCGTTRVRDKTCDLGQLRYDARERKSGAAGKQLLSYLAAQRRSHSHGSSSAQRQSKGVTAQQKTLIPEH